MVVSICRQLIFGCVFWVWTVIVGLDVVLLLFISYFLYGLMMKMGRDVRQWGYGHGFKTRKRSLRCKR